MEGVFRQRGAIDLSDRWHVHCWRVQTGYIMQGKQEAGVFYDNEVNYTITMWIIYNDVDRDIKEF